jgi:superfamily I DNA/RNA helicase
VPKEIVVLGPPGTGKTSSGIISARDWFKRGISTNEVAYLAFTKAAAHEAGSRIMDEDFKKDFGDHLPYFRTLHSLAYMGLRKAKPEIRLVTPADMKAFAKWSSMDGAYAVMQWEDMADVYRKLQERGRADKTYWDKCLDAYSLSRICAKNIDELKRAKVEMTPLAWNIFSEIGGVKEMYAEFVRKYETYKEVNGIVDFTDMLEYALTKMEPIDEVRKVVIDECLPAGTRITMANGFEKPIEEVRIGDHVVGVDHETGKTKKAVVVETRRRTASEFIIINGILTLTGNHPVFVVGKGYVRADGVSVGEKIAKQDMRSCEGGSSKGRWKSKVVLQIDTIRSVEKVSSQVPVYNIGTETENYFAEGVLVHNCQDLSPILFSISERIFSNSEEIYYLGDDDQCIYKFSGADAGTFIAKARSATKIYLQQTHRFGDDIVEFSKRIISSVSDRVKKDVIGARGMEHLIKMTGSFQPTSHSDTLLLHRHVAGCQALGQMYIAAGMPFRNERGRDPLGSHARVEGYQALRKLADGKTVTSGELSRLVDDLMHSIVVDESQGGKKVRFVVHGGKKKLQNIGGSEMNIMDLIRAKILTVDGAEAIRQKHFSAFKHSEDLEYYDSVVENGFDLEGTCPLITTIHGSKGRETKTDKGKVILFSEMGQKCWDDADTEYRLGYVGVTRTKGELEICAESVLPWSKVSHFNYPQPTKPRGPSVTPVVTEEQ